ncbi:LysR substrate-binding domain-containing protein [Burkholderia gladioli]|jgi:DNA-binding transcriptional LysR family regulator|uniref:Bacterial regulatory helix-turn-helix, lysR family protein n=1 Tax=Burkholderia gladioli TaxID=28095 RepID=A0AAW7R7D7_BURGA|nr:LysR substrate-binding domain-containing protein [Burkholderia gladioli]AJW95001.1 bacterial regulatory helix-turn-helix, lysR family protein [Burkholderia gladioli]ASD83086.1 LysR family transcriptional regulator [Burkholderia gladioli pv. gladioli]AWY50519.1 LysR family transcriptional regulator [Burkholderia gladioli pv. gladioli]KAF1059404.1 HTH-type transcriptional regulator YjiE [Burkholderia gladioli]KGC13421.1 bacterial regulatory helix-turn-helix, lysR family protein [Burkholderia 
MEIKWIEDFIALAQYQSFSRAAEFRNVTQSGFSRRIQSLEQWVGAELIDRSSFPPVLTPAGRLFREAADDILHKLHDTRAIIRNEQRIAGRGLQIAAGHTIALNFLPGWLKALSGHFGEVRARVVPANVHDSILSLVNGNCELMFAYHHPELPLHLDPARYEHLTVGLDTLLPVSQPTPRAAPRFRLPGTSKAALPLISYTETSYFGRCQALLLSRAPATPMLRLHFESDMAEVLKKLVVEGEGLAWLPRSAIARELAAGELVPAGPAAWQLEVELRVYRDTSNRGAFVDTLWQHLRASI